MRVRFFLDPVGLFSKHGRFPFSDEFVSDPVQDLLGSSEFLETLRGPWLDYRTVTAGS